MKPLYLPTICRPFWPWFSLLIEQLIAQLDDDQFKVREKATAELNRIGERIVPALDAALAKERPLESSNRLHGLRTKMIGAVLEGERLRTYRAVEVLERIGTPEARQLLKTMAEGAPEAMLTTAAAAR